MSDTSIVSSFIEGAPPGELNEVVTGIKSLTSDTDPALLSKVKDAFQKYNESQFVTVKLPGASQSTIISPYNRHTSPSSYIDPNTSQTFTYDHTTSTASNIQPSSTARSSLESSISNALSTHFAEHFPPTSSQAGFLAVASDSSNKIHILLTSLKSSPSNFISGRWRSHFVYDSARSELVSGEIKVQVHYYEDGNVALSTSKQFRGISVAGGSAEAVVAAVAKAEKAYQEELNRGLVAMNEGSFRGLRRQLPVTRQRIEWERVRGYGLGENLRGEVGGKK